MVTNVFGYAKFDCSQTLHIRSPNIRETRYPDLFSGYDIFHYIYIRISETSFFIRTRILANKWSIHLQISSQIRNSQS